jgi:GNAT superfamily N-acetyltransferase
MSDVVVRRATADPAHVVALAEILVDCVEDGASVGFMLPLAQQTAEEFWVRTLDSAARGERIIFVAEESSTGALLGTVHVILTAPQNQPHRGEISKMLVRPSARRGGIADALMRAAEQAAIEAGKTLLVLDTASAQAERLYERRGWHRAGVIPRYALWPSGGYVDAVFFYKDLPA